jgi:hypothetical protein
MPWRRFCSIRQDDHSANLTVFRLRDIRSCEGQAGILPIPSIEKKKRILIPLGTPRQSGSGSLILRTVLKLIFLPIFFVIGKTYKLCFGWSDRRIAIKNQGRFAQEIQTHLSFLFADHGAQIIPNDAVPFPPVSMAHMLPSPWKRCYFALSVGVSILMCVLLRSAHPINGSKPAAVLAPMGFALGDGDVAIDGEIGEALDEAARLGPFDF